MSRKSKKSDLNFLHPISSLGIKEVSLSGVRVERLEDRIDPKVPFPHKHDFFQTIVLFEGAGTHQIDFMKHKVNEQSVYLMKPGQVHHWKFSKKVQGMIIEFNSDSFLKEIGSSQILDQLWSAPDVLFPKREEGDVIRSMAKELFSEFQTPALYSDLALRQLLGLFFIRVLRLIQADQTLTKSDGRGVQFKKLVEAHFRQEHRVEFYADLMKLSPKALTMQMTRILGRSPRSIIQERIILEAKRLLAFSEHSVAEVGYELGFDDPNYFTRFFRLQEKISPAIFRKRSEI